MPSTYVRIATTTLGSAASTITFNGIPSNYTDLKIVFIGNCVSPSRYLALAFNSDSSTNYSMTYVSGDGAAERTSYRTNDTSLYSNNYSGASTTIPQMIIADIFSYSGSTNKTTLFTTASDKSGSGNVDSAVGLWRSNDAITSIALKYVIPADISAGSIATLYGIKNA
jgi:hypothetical protein